MLPGGSIYHASKRLEEVELLPASPECPVCGSRDRNPLLFLQKDPDVRLYRCNTCACISASRFPTDAALSDYYTTYYDEDVYESSADSVTFHDIGHLADLIQSVVEPHCDSAYTKILDFGGGDGALSQHLAERLLGKSTEVSIDLVDYNADKASDTAQGVHLHSYTGLDELTRLSGSRESGYDVVIASAVLEHIPNPREVLRDLTSLLKPGGVIYIRTPAIYPLMALLGRFGIHVDFTFPGHLHDMGAEFWTTYFKKFTAQKVNVLVSRPSPVETSFRKNFVRTLAAHVLKMPWRILGDRYKLVGGWEVYAQKSLD